MDLRRIAKLSENLANQIAAGEVVERPGAALKEIMENSLDAGAKNIRVAIRGGGSELLEVADDGHGIHADDILLALDRHATSKIRRTEDLFAIDSWGFRGEALASIAAVSRLSLSSRTAEAGTGRAIVMEGGTMREDRAAPRPVGTTVKIEDLFFNTPARKSFLKSPAAETAYATQVFHRLALGSFATSFELTINGARAYLYPAAASAEERIADVYRTSWKIDLEQNELMKVEAESAPLKLKAWILPSKHHIPSSRGILCYVNKRAVKDKLLQQAVLAAAKETLFGHLYPQLVLFLETPFEGVDVNVHPTKAEVRFRESGHVFAFVRKYLERALASDRRGSVSFAPAPVPESYAPSPLFSAPASFPGGGSVIGAAPPWQFGHTGADGSPSTFAPIFPAGAMESSGQSPAAPVTISGIQFLGTLKNTYLVCQDADGLLLVDQHAAHERVTYERLRSHRLTASSAPLLIPIQVELPREALDRMEADFPKLAELGLGLDRTGPTLLAVREIPSLLLRRDGSPAVALGPFLRKLSQTWDETVDLEAAVKEKMLDTLASESCHGSVRAGQNLSAPEAQALLSQMSATDFSGHCPHGRPTTVRFRWTEIERFFKRVF